MRVDSNFPEDNSFPMVAEGEQVLTVESVISMQSNAGNDMVVFDLIDGEGNQVRHYCMNYEKGGKNIRWMLKKTIWAITGVKPATGPTSFETGDLEGCKIRVVVGRQKSKKGNVFAAITDVIPPDEDSPGQTSIDEFDSGEVVGKDGEAVPF